MRHFLSESEKARIEAATRKVEQQTLGEVVTVISAASDSYRYIPLLWAAFMTLATPALLSLFGNLSLTNIYAIQLLVFIGFWGAFRWPPLRRFIVPTAVQQRRARRLAYESFHRIGLQNTSHKAGVLIFVSVEEHYVQIIADSGINNAAPDGLWDKAVEEFIENIRNGSIVDGFEQCIEHCGALLIEKFPATGDTPANELTDVLIELGYEDFEQ